MTRQSERDDAWGTSDGKGRPLPTSLFGSPASSLSGALWLCGPASRRGCPFVGKEPLMSFLLRPRTCVGFPPELLEVSFPTGPGSALDEDLAAELVGLDQLDLVTAPELPGVVPAHRPLVRQQAHVLHR